MQLHNPILGILSCSAYCSSLLSAYISLDGLRRVLLACRPEDPDFDPEQARRDMERLALIKQKRFVPSLCSGSPDSRAVMRSITGMGDPLFTVRFARRACSLVHVEPSEVSPQCAADFRS